MCRFTRFFLVTEAERKHVKRGTRFQQHGYASYEVCPPPSLQGKAPKEIHAILTETLGEHASSYATIKTWVAQFKRGDFSTCDAPRPGRPKKVTTLEIFDQIHDLIFEDRRISATSIAEQLGFSRERVGSIIHEDLDTRKLSAKWVPKCLNADQKHQRCQSSEQRLEFFRRDSNNFLPRLVTMDETWLYHYDPETNQQSMEWRHSGSPRPKKFRVQISAGKVLASIFSNPDGILLTDYPNYQRGVLIIPGGAIEGHFEGKTPRKAHQGCLTGHLQPRRHWPTWASRVLITHLILRI